MKQRPATSLADRGTLRYTLTNDFMFKAFLQRNEKALRGLLCALLKLKREEILSVTIMNPIEEGTEIRDKTIVLDLKIKMNNSQIINMEMQVADLGNWEERSLTYLCRSFDQLRAGEDYRNVLKVVHIGILDFTPRGFPEEFFMEYYLYNKKTKHIYSDKICIFMLQLNQLKDSEEMSDLYVWGRLFLAKTWEEIEMLAEKNESIRESIVTLQELSEDEKIQMQCEARERLRRDFVSATQLGMEKGLQEGLQEGLEEGRVIGAIEIMRDMGVEEEKILLKIKEKYNISEEKIRELMA